MGRAARATTINQVLTDLGNLRQDVERLRRTVGGASQQDALSEAAAWKAACSAMLSLPGLRLFAPMSSFDENGDAFDLSGQGRTLSYNGNPTYNYDGLAPYIAFDGTGDYLSRATEAGLDILGTEAYVAAGVRGLTLGGWFYPEEIGTLEHIFSKWGAALQRSYRLALTVPNQFNFRISDDGTNFDSAISAAVSMNSWYFVVGRFDPAVEVSVWVNEVEAVQATVRAGVFNSNAALAIGAQPGGASPFQGRTSLCFLCAALHSDALVRALFAATRGLFRRW